MYLCKEVCTGNCDHTGQQNVTVQILYVTCKILYIKTRKLIKMSSDLNDQAILCIKNKIKYKFTSVVLYIGLVSLFLTFFHTCVKAFYTCYLIVYRNVQFIRHLLIYFPLFPYQTRNLKLTRKTTRFQCKTVSLRLLRLGTNYTDCKM